MSNTTTVIIILPSPAVKHGRFIPAGEEWVEGWGFSRDEHLRFRINDQESEACKNADGIPDPQQNSRLVIWVNTIHLGGENLLGALNTILTKLKAAGVQGNAIRIAYHGEHAEWIPEEIKPNSKPYDLAKFNEARFKRIVKDDKLNPEAPFEAIYECFFLLTSRRGAVLHHELTHTLLCIDLDLEGWRESGFNPQYAKEIGEAYGGGKATRALTRARELVYQARDANGQLVADKADSMEKIKEEILAASGKEIHNQPICPQWEKITELLPKNSTSASGTQSEKFQRVIEILTLLDSTEASKMEQLQRKFEEWKGNPFHEWYLELDKALDEFRNLLQADSSEPKR